MITMMPGPSPRQLQPPETRRLITPVVLLNGVGPERAAQLTRLGVRTVGELLLLRPRRYEDRRQVAQIASLHVDMTSMARGQIVDLGVKRYARGAKSTFEFILEDGTGRLHCRWWNMPYLEQQFRRGDEVLVYGRVKLDRPKTMDHPETEVIESGQARCIHLERVVPIYPLTEGLSQRFLRRLIHTALEDYLCAIEELGSDQLEGFVSRRDAVRWLHFPEQPGDAERARRRLALDEWIATQMNIQARRRALLRNAGGLICPGDNRLIKPFLRQLGFQLRAGQRDVLRDIRADLRSGRPMRRLLQGEVGSGKTVVAGCAALMALESGYNALLMAPTEILAEQHFDTFRRWFEPLGISVGIRTASHRATIPETGSGGGTAGPERNRFIVGTHALLQESFVQEDLGLVIIDEQHKFGVAQRERLVKKGHYPHLLVMTATPIPRTLALALYGELDVSIIAGEPGGRKHVKTVIRSAGALPKVWRFVRSQLAEGRQAYVVYPRVEDDAGGGVKAATKEFESLQQALAPYAVGLLHGRMKSAEKEATMNAFRRNTIQVLLSTAVVEVGMDVPNATVLVVENAEQFGLAQLHQLRGRVGRGEHPSYCVLITGRADQESRARLQILSETSDGFEIAEADLKIRGPGEVIGRAQSGAPALQFADWSADLDLVEKARGIAVELLDQSDL